jgi:hypothetical protein
MSVEMKELRGGPCDGLQVPAVDTTILIPASDERPGYFASYTDVGLFYKFDNKYYTYEELQILGDCDEEDSK